MPFRGVFPAEKVEQKPYGLFSVATVVNHSGADEHWVGGYGIDNETCNIRAEVLDICATATSYEFAVPGDLDPQRLYHPFGIRAEYRCTSVGMNVSDGRARVTRQLELATQKGVEFELLAGTYTLDAQDIDDRNDYLSNADVVEMVSGSTQRSAELGIAMLEQAFANCSLGTEGVIHAPVGVVALLGDKLNTASDRPFLETLNGNKVVSGSGYDGRGPGETATPADILHPWVYITGPVTVHLGPIEVMTPDNQSIVNVKTNETTYVAVRPAIATWDGCCVFAVQVDLTK